MNIVAYPISFIFGLAYGISRANPATVAPPEEQFFVQMIGMLIGLTVSVTYYLVSEGLWQRSIAKFITGTRVVNATGGVPTFGQILGRTFARFIPFEAFSFLTSNPVGWHDSLSGTRVVKVR